MNHRIVNCNEKIPTKTHKCLKWNNEVVWGAWELWYPFCSTTLFCGRKKHTKNNQFSHQQKKSEIHWNKSALACGYPLKCTCEYQQLARKRRCYCAQEKNVYQMNVCEKRSKQRKENRGIKKNFWDKTVFRVFSPFTKYVNKPKKQHKLGVDNCVTSRTLVAMAEPATSTAPLPSPNWMSSTKKSEEIICLFSVRCILSLTLLMLSLLFCFFVYYFFLGLVYGRVCVLVRGKFSRLWNCDIVWWCAVR